MTRTKGRQCDGKIRYGSKEAAETALFKAVRERGVARWRLGVYRCPHCSVPGDTGWHVGHKLRSRGKQ